MQCSQFLSIVVRSWLVCNVVPCLFVSESAVFQMFRLCVEVCVGKQDGRVIFFYVRYVLVFYILHFLQYACFKVSVTKCKHINVFFITCMFKISVIFLRV